MVGIREGKARVSYQRLAEAVLVDWREAELQIEQTLASSPEAASLRAVVVDLRDEYQQLIDRARGSGHPVPPPFPAAVPGDAPHVPSLSWNRPIPAIGR